MEVLRDAPEAGVAPTFRPTAEEFSDFDALALAIYEAVGDSYGIAKIIPPPCWNPGKRSRVTPTVRNPVAQVISSHPYVSGVKTIASFVTAASVPAKTFQAEAAPMPESLLSASSEEIERAYWRSLTVHADSPVYGADVTGSIFTKDDSTPFNISHLGDLLSECGDELPGVCSSMLYFGTWRSTFPMHTEDAELFSINYNASGASKHWLAIPPAQAPRFESLCASWFPEEHKNCPEFLRHKTTLISPLRLRKEGLVVHRAVQRENEIILTFPRGYHCGFNAGINLAESVNFLPKAYAAEWLEKYGQHAQTCACRPDAVNAAYVCEMVRREMERKDVVAPSPSPRPTPSPSQCPLRADDDECDFLLESDEDAWTHVKVAARMDGFCRLHVPFSPKANDFWVRADSRRVRRRAEPGGSVRKVRRRR